MLEGKCDDTDDVSLFDHRNSQSRQRSSGRIDNLISPSSTRCVKFRMGPFERDPLEDDSAPPLLLLRTGQTCRPTCPPHHVIHGEREPLWRCLTRALSRGKAAEHAVFESHKEFLIISILFFLYAQKIQQR